ncbi:hypothetical protein Rumal_3747 (plasmid) [Ruminococcus albus 7 = DSM 20455]|uniref:Uncharacterized protein n=1 Tax=Ruminococcus albus (strain ATCC 27210 / DSM 20455 / JCM 14654 / NCDO 2250 / 7) TaxID=697329 RepID=E6UKI6_RUMA7|nr:hypothetical protein Rumal_3747 [Ruminococcus albus 7 = DSM 20455]
MIPTDATTAPLIESSTCLKLKRIVGIPAPPMIFLELALSSVRKISIAMQPIKTAALTIFTIFFTFSLHTESFENEVLHLVLSDDLGEADLLILERCK